MDRRAFLVSSLASSALCAMYGNTLAASAELLQQEGHSPEALAAALREKLMDDPFRPQFHLLPRANWMNDPCAPRYFRGQYHMFFQYNPGAAIWGDMHWAHAISPDLIHWKHLPIALSPSPDSYDSFGCFTGSVLPGVDVPTILYTGVTRSSPELETIRDGGVREVQCLATSTDPGLRTWKKLDKPVLDGPPPGLKVTGFRDPCPWRDEDTWYLCVGSGFTEIGGAVLLYRSSDGRNWTYLHPLAQGKWIEGMKGNPVDTGEMWECPDFFALGDKHVLLYSTAGNVYWEVGVFDKRELRFYSETRGVLDHGHYYAMKSMVDAKDRRILWGWVQETRSADECKAAGWAGAMALPRVLTLGPDNELRMEVPPEFASLRRDVHKLEATHNPNALNAALKRMPIQNRAGEIVCSFQPGGSPCGLELRTAEASQGEPLFAIRYDGTQDKPAVAICGKTIPLSPNKDGISTIHLWMDGSIFEVFLESKEAMTARCYKPSSSDIQVAWTGAADQLKTMSISGVKPISDDRLTL